MGPKEDPELQRQIEANEGIFEPLLLEPHPDIPNKFRIIDGDRRWTNSKILVDNQKKEQYRRIPAEITDRTLTDEEGLAFGSTSIGEGVNGTLKKRRWSRTASSTWLAGQAQLTSSGSRSELDKLVEIYDLSEKLTNLAEQGASITWAREIKNLNKKLLTPSVLDT